MLQIIAKEYKTGNDWMEEEILWEYCKKLKCWPYEQVVNSQIRIHPK